MKKNNNDLRNIPQVEKLLQTDVVSEFIPVIGRGIVLKIIKQEVELHRTKLQKGLNLNLDDLIRSIIDKCNRKKYDKLQRVINGTGVLIHTNLGRAPISKEILTKLQEELAGYSNLEIDLLTGKRGKRGVFAEELISFLTSSEDALIVNNNAASLFLILNEFAKDKDVIISRSELVQIGGGFRIPDILKQTGANLIEVGTTNITYLEDYRSAISNNTTMILSVHQSNFRVEGFTRSPSLKELASLKSQSILFVRDLGSGNLVVDTKFPKKIAPTASFEYSQGTDIVCFSGDKLLGCCQSGIIIGKRDLINKLRRNPLMRILRVDKIAYFLLQETLIHYINGDLDKISLWNIIFQNKKTISNRVNKLYRNIKASNKKEVFKKMPLKSVFGGGALPTIKIESIGVQIDHPNLKGEEIYEIFISGHIPIVGYIMNDRFTLDLRTIYDEDIIVVAEAIDRLLEGI